MRKFNSIRDLVQYKLSEHEGNSSAPVSKNTHIQRQVPANTKQYIPSTLISNMAEKKKSQIQVKDSSFQTTETPTQAKSNFKGPNLKKLMS